MKKLLVLYCLFVSLGLHAQSDKYEPIILQNGDTLQTGVPILVVGEIIQPASVSQPKIIEAGEPEVVLTNINVHIVGIPKVVKALSFIPNLDSSSIVFVNANGDTVPTGIAIPTVGNIVDTKQPKPTSALPLKFNDNVLYNIQNLDVNQGMLSSYLFCMLEDSRGNIWFGTYSGVSKYDGISFTHYTEKEGLSHNVVRSIIEDKSGNIWFGTEGGVSKYDGKSFTHYTEKEGLIKNNIYSILEDKSGNLWFGAKGGCVSKFDGKSFTHYTANEGLSNNSVRVMLEDKSGNIWFGTQGRGVSKFDGKSFTHYTVKEGLSHNIVMSMLEDKSGNIWFGTAGGVSKFDGKSFTHFTEKEGLSSNQVLAILEDKRGDLWFGTGGGGVSKYDGKSFTHYTTKEGLSNNVVWSIIEDISGNIWFATNGGGVSKYDAKPFTHFTDEEGRNRSGVRSFLEDKRGNLWFGAGGRGGGVSKYNGKSFTHYTEGFYENTPIRSIIEDKRGNLWFGSDGNGVSKFDGKSFTHYTVKEGLSHNVVLAILEDKRGDLWFGTGGGGVSRYDGESFTHYTEKEGLCNNAVWSIIEDKSGNLWFSTEGGVSKYDGKYFTHYTEKEGLCNNNAKAMLEDKSGNLWFGSNGNGVSKYDGISFTNYTEKEGLSNDVVWSIIEDNNNNIWLGTQNGLTVIEYTGPVLSNTKNVNELKKSHQKISKFMTLDGLNGLAFSRAVLLDSQNRLWWGTWADGMTMLDMSQFALATNPPIVSLNRVDINEGFLDFRALKDSLHEGTTYGEVPAFSNYPLNLNLPYDKNHLTFHYSAIDWSASHKIKYSYKILEIDKDWSETTSEIKADYRNLSFGNYTFKVRAIGESHEWSKPFEYSFTILPPWWHTWWARTAYGILVLLSIWLLVKIQTKKLVKRQEDLECEVDKAIAEIKEQKEEIEEAHKEITDSINYAERIQFSFLATKEMLDQNLGEHFVFFRPKDVVSGDFYWADKLSNGDFAIVNADSTGHGVPGAIMSILNISSIEQAIEQGAETPSQIFNESRKRIIQRLKKDGSEHGGKDGMDASIVCFNADKTKMTYTAAQNPIWVIRGDEVIQIKAEKMPVGKHDNDHVPFEGGEFDLQKGDKVYTLTDGFQDQFGGPRGKKFMIKKMREYVLSISHLPMQEQCQKLDKVFSDWKAGMEQVDDVCVIGIKV